MLPAMQLPIQPFLLLVCFNIFSQSVNPLLLSLASWWGTILTLSSPLFIILESVSSLLVVQKLGQVGRDLVGKGEVYQFVLLIVSAVAYVVSAWWIVAVSLFNFPEVLTSNDSTIRDRLIPRPPCHPCQPLCLVLR